MSMFNLRRRRADWLWLALVLAFASLAGAQASAQAVAQTDARIALDDDLASELDSVVTPLVDKQEAVGYAVGLIKEGRVVALRTYGMADREQNIPVDRQTMFRWASVSKTITAVAAMQLFEQGKLDLDADVRQYVPEFPDKAATVTTRQLLCHQGGIRHYANGTIVPNERTYEAEHPFESVILAIDDFKDSPLIFAPGKRFAYSTHGYILLSAVVERAGEAPFAEQVQSRICRPLGMASLQPDYQWIEIPGRAVGYRKKEGSIERSTDTDVSWKLGGGGYVSTIDDMALWCTAVARGELLQPETWKLISTPVRPAEGPASGYGLGFRVQGAGDRLCISHSGAQEKTRTHLAAFPKAGFGVVAMTNSEYGKPQAIVAEAIKVYLDFEPFGDSSE